jgi:hypothetical protein
MGFEELMQNFAENLHLGPYFEVGKRESKEV